MRFDPKTKETKPFTNDSGKANGLICTSDGILYACEGPDHGGLRVAAWNLKTGMSKTITALFMDKKYNGPNDLCLNSQGQIYFTDPRYMGHEMRELEHRAVYRVNPDGTGLVEITHEVEKPNGIALSPDGMTLYVADHNNGTDQIDPSKPAPKQGAMAIYSYPLNRGGLVDGKRKTLYDFGDMKGCDGMCVDVQGNLYLTQRDPSRPGVLIINPEGKEVAFIPTGPEDQDPKEKLVGIPSNVEFGIGPELKTLYITVDMSLYRIPMLVEGFHVQYQKK
jgi:gluconolactonase